MIEEDRTRSITGWKSLLRAIGADAEAAVDRVRHRFASRFRPDDRLHVVAYRGFGNEEFCTLGGRVLRYRETPDSSPDTLWRTLQESYRRFETDEVPGVRVRARFSEPHVTRSAPDTASASVAVSAAGADVTASDSDDLEVTSDDEGYFNFRLATPVSPTNATLSLTLSLPDHPDAVIDGVAEVVLPGADMAFGVISDIDDTVLVTQATSLLKMMRLTLLESSESRVAFPGVAAFYKALHGRGNPFFYVSSSPWNLHEFLQDFMRLKGIVAGPLMLRDFGLDRDKLVAGPHLEHKLTQIRTVLDRYPAKSFILIGDSGQKDPEVYRQIVADYPNRVLAVYIRDVSGDVRDRAVASIIDELEAQGVDMLLVPDTLAAARHAATRGWITEAAVSQVADDVAAERQPVPAIDEQVV